MPAPQPTLIRGQLYPSQAAAARALKLHPATIQNALERGAIDQVGSGLPGRKGRRCYMNGKLWPSQSAAARALGVRRASICKALDAGRTYVRPGGKGRFA